MRAQQRDELRKGDKVECTKESTDYDDHCTVGKIYEVAEIQDKQQGIRVLNNDRGNIWWVDIYCFRRVEDEPVGWEMP